MKYNVVFCVSGNGSLAKAAIKHSNLLNINPKILIADVNANDELEIFCKYYNVKYLNLNKVSKDLINEYLYKILSQYLFDLVCLTFDRIIQPKLVELYKGRMINVHPSILPSFAGTNALKKSTRYGVRFVGATIHEVDIEIDKGPIITQCVLPLTPNNNYIDIGKQIYRYLEPMFLQTIKWYSDHRVFKDEIGRVWIKDADYGSLPISPSIELDNYKHDIQIISF